MLKNLQHLTTGSRHPPTKASTRGKSLLPKSRRGRVPDVTWVGGSRREKPGAGSTHELCQMSPNLRAHFLSQSYTDTNVLSSWGPLADNFNVVD